MITVCIMKEQGRRCSITVYTVRQLKIYVTVLKYVSSSSPYWKFTKGVRVLGEQLEIRGDKRDASLKFLYKIGKSNLVGPLKPF